MNITLKISTVNLKNRLPQEVQVFSAEELQEFIKQGTVIKKNKQYLLIIHHRQFTLQCPILHMNDGGYQLIWPSFKLPNRPYPVFVYLNAVAWYLSSGESMRSTAQKVIHVFGLSTFSHSTLCRFLPKLYPILPSLYKLKLSPVSSLILSISLFGSIVLMGYLRKNVVIWMMGMCSNRGLNLFHKI